MHREFYFPEAPSENPMGRRLIPGELGQVRNPSMAMGGPVKRQAENYLPGCMTGWAGSWRAGGTNF